MKRIGILGGTFDPVHYGHLIIGEMGREALGLDEIWFMPTGLSPHKDEKKITSLEHRLAMLNLVIAKNPGFILSDFEVNSGEVNYTYRTMERLSEQYPEHEIFYFMGGDSLEMFEIWKKPEVISKYCTLVVANRDAVDSEKIQFFKKKYESMYGTKIQELSIPQFDVSSSVIRQRAKEGKSLRYLLPEEVITYIKEHHLYEDGQI